METVQRYSKKRQAIYETLLRSTDHPSAESVYQSLKPDFPDLSLGTVYRNLKSMVASGDVICVSNVDGKDRFDAHTAPHIHLICRCCGGVQDLELTEEITGLCQLLSQRSGTAIDPTSLRLTGLCHNCIDREAPDPNSQTFIM